MDPIDSWPRCTEAARFFEAQLRDFLSTHPRLAQIAGRCLQEAGVNLLNLVDHWALPDTPALAEQLTASGLVPTTTEDGDGVWEHPQARLPRVRLISGASGRRLALAVEDAELFLEVHRLSPAVVRGERDSAYQEAVVPLEGEEMAAVVRQGYRGFRSGRLSEDARARLAQARAALRSRGRDGDEEACIRQAHDLAAFWAAKLGQARVADEFFAAEREYYMARNRAARWQYDRQQALGLGWANHDHHTYRSSRTGFRALMRLWQTLGFHPRERFYAGAEAGWGAQILEHGGSRVVIFADVDMTPEELDIDFAGEALPPVRTLGTIGLWCALHGSSIAEAGMHHLEAEFDWDRSRTDFEAAGFGVMAPFTDLPVLKQAFTQPELWPVAPEHVQTLRNHGFLSAAQAERFLTQGAAGSHLEILQRWDGFKGFNKTGVSAIIRETDARRASVPRGPARPKEPVERAGA